jgi:hypothetical protein
MANPLTQLVADIRRKLAKLKPSHPYFDPFDAMMTLWGAFEAERVAIKAGRPFSELPHAPLSAEQEHLVELALRESDRIAERLAEERRG